MNPSFLVARWIPSFAASIVTASSLGALLFTSTAAKADDCPDVAEIEPVSWTGLASPESVAHDLLTDTYFVSNINGPVAAKDNNGFIAKLDPAGGAATRWVEGGRHGVTLHAPKGLVLAFDTVWVADIDTVRGFHRRTGQPVAEISIPGATFLNDIALGLNGDLYVTDSGVGPDATGAIVPTGTDAVYRIDEAKVIHTIAAGTHLNQPNGIFRTWDGFLWVTTRGADELLRIDPAGNVIRRTTVPGRIVDGVQVLPDGRVVVSTWQQPGLWLVHRDGRTEAFIPGASLPVATDFSVDRRRSTLLLPSLPNNELLVVKIPKRRF